MIGSCYTLLSLAPRDAPSDALAWRATLLVLYTILVASRFRATCRTNPRETKKTQPKITCFEERTFGRGTCRFCGKFGISSNLPKFADSQLFQVAIPKPDSKNVPSPLASQSINCSRTSWYEVCNLNSTFFLDEKRIWKTKYMTPCPPGRFEGELTLSTQI